VAIRPAVREESEDKLARFDKVVAGESLSGGGFGPFGASGTKPIKPFAAIRTRSVLEQLAGTSQGSLLFRLARCSKYVFGIERLG
jgi:hypothetical protein